MIIAAILFVGFTPLAHAQNIGIGISNPSARLHVADSNVLFSANGDIPATPHNVPVSGSGRRLVWYPDKAAFRAGFVAGNNWNKDSIGNYSFASGRDIKARGIGATAFGEQSSAQGEASLATGFFSSATGDVSTAMGNSTASGYASFASGSGATASADYAMACGFVSLASGIGSVALGYGAAATGARAFAVGSSAYAPGFSSTALGNFTAASGSYSTSIGSQTTSSGDFSVALGYKTSTNGHAGAFFFGDSDPNNKGVRPIGFNDQFAARFNGGYYFITSDAGADIGVRCNAGQNSWSAISDVRLKEKFLPIDGELFLDKISRLQLTTWNYKGQSSASFRHYGPMAQDFFAAFGHDELGTIGCDTLINQQDFLGVNLVAIQALEKRTAELKKSVESSNEIINELKRQVESKQTQIEYQQKQIDDLKEMFSRLLATKQSLSKQ